MKIIEKEEEKENNCGTEKRTISRSVERGFHRCSKPSSELRSKIKTKRETFSKTTRAMKRKGRLFRTLKRIDLKRKSQTIKDVNEKYETNVAKGLLRVD